MKEWVDERYRQARPGGSNNHGSRADFRGDAAFRREVNALRGDGNAPRALPPKPWPRSDNQCQVSKQQRGFEDTSQAHC